MAESPAEEAGLQVGDVITAMRIIKCDNDECTSGINERYEIMVPEDLLAFDEKYAGEIVYVSYTRDGNPMTTEVKLNGADEEYILGAAISGDRLYMSSWSAPIVGIGTTIQLTGETFKGVGQLFVNLFQGLAKQINVDSSVRESGAKDLEAAGDSVTGPVGIVGILFPNMVQMGGRGVLFLIALISVSLACMNILPIPALDGGRWLMIAIARLRKKKLSKATEEKIVTRSFIVILILAVIITVLDIMRFF
jgi:regulator of sigma E protease